MIANGHHFEQLNDKRNRLELAVTTDARRFNQTGSPSLGVEFNSTELSPAYFLYADPKRGASCNGIW